MSQIKVSHMIRLLILSGAENHLLVLLPELAKAGVDTELIAITEQTPPALIREALENLRGAGVRVTVIPLRERTLWHTLGLQSIQRTLDIFNVLKNRRERIIHLHLEFFGFPIAAWMAGCAKVVMSIHADDGWFGTFPMRVWLKIVDGVIKRYIAISERVKAHYSSSTGIDRQKMTLVYHGVKEEAGASTSAQVREAHNIPADAFVIGFLGRLHPQKNVEMLIEAARRMPAIHCVIVGDGENRAALQQQAKGLANVHLLGFQPKGSAIIPAFDLFCLPSRVEGLGLVLIEAMLKGVPIAGSRAGAIPEILKNGHYGLLFDNNNLDELIDVIQYAIDNKENLRQMSIRAKEYAKESFTVQRMTEQTIQVYERIEKESR